MSPRPLLALWLLLCAGCAVHVGPGDAAWKILTAGHRGTAALDAGYRMHYVDLGRQDAQAVVMVHGYGDSSYAFSRTVRPLLAAGFRVVALDQAGLGRSEIPPEPFVYSVENQARQVLALADRLGLRRFHLVGHSMGGGVALYIAWKHPERLRSVVPIAPASFNPAGALSVLGRLPVAGLVEPLFRRWVIRTALLDVTHDDRKVSEAMVDEYARVTRKKGFMRVLMLMVAQYFSDQHEAMTRAFATIRTPMLIVWGEEDRWLPCWRGGELASQVPGALYVRVPAAGHMVHMERPEVVNPFLLKFLQIHSR